MQAERYSVSRWRYLVWGTMSRSPTPRATASVCCSRSRAIGMRRSRDNLGKKVGETSSRSLLRDMHRLEASPTAIINRFPVQHYLSNTTGHIGCVTKPALVHLLL